MTNLSTNNLIELSEDATASKLEPTNRQTTEQTYKKKQNEDEKCRNKLN